MKKNRFAFTFIEILVAISILSIVSIFALSWFSRNFERQSLNEELVFFQDTLKKLEKDIGKNTTDYQIFINKWEIYYYTINKNYLKNTQNIVNFQSYTWVIQTSSGTDFLKIFSDNMLIHSYSGSQIYEYSFDQKTNYKIETSNTWKKLNSLYIYHYKNIDAWKKVYLMEIKNGTQTYDSIQIKNTIGQKRQILTNSGQIISWNILLTFEDNKWITTFLQLTQ